MVGTKCSLFEALGLLGVSAYPGTRAALREKQMQLPGPAGVSPFDSAIMDLGTQRNQSKSRGKLQSRSVMHAATIK